MSESGWDGNWGGEEQLKQFYYQLTPEQKMDLLDTAKKLLTCQSILAMLIDISNSLNKKPIDLKKPTLLNHLFN